MFSQKLFLLLYLFFQQLYCDEISLTTNVHFSGQRWITPLIYFSHNFDLEIISHSIHNSAYPNRIKISNFALNVNANVSAVFPLLLYFDSFENFIECIPTNDNGTACEANFPNGKMKWAFDVRGEANTTMNDFIELFVHDGILYKSSNGCLFTLEKNCINYEGRIV